MLRHTQRVQKIAIEHCSSLHLGEAGLRKLSHETLEDQIRWIASMMVALLFHMCCFYLLVEISQVL